MLRKYLILLMPVIFFSGCIKPSEKDVIASQFYMEGAYDKALAEWQQLCGEGISDPDVFYNMGIAAAQEGKIPLAMMNLERAIRFSPGNDQYTSALVEIRSRIENAVIPVDTFFLADWWRTGTSIVRPGIWALIALLLFILGVVRLLQDHKIIRLEIMAIPGQAFIYLFTGVLLLVIAFSSYSQIHRRNEGIVFGACEMKEGPSDQSPFVREVAPGEKIKIMDAIPGWTKVNLLNLDEGWIKDECYRLINPEQCQ